MQLNYPAVRPRNGRPSRTRRHPLSSICAAAARGGIFSRHDVVQYPTRNAYIETSAAHQPFDTHQKNRLLAQRISIDDTGHYSEYSESDKNAYSALAGTAAEAEKRRGQIFFNIVVFCFDQLLADIRFFLNVTAATVAGMTAHLRRVVCAIGIHHCQVVTLLPPPSTHPAKKCRELCLQVVNVPYRGRFLPEQKG
jgi:hypothetical protein